MKMKERQIGEIVTINDKQYITMESDENDCSGCDVYFLVHSCDAYHVGECSMFGRKDRKSVIFKLMEKNDNRYKI